MLCSCSTPYLYVCLHVYLVMFEILISREQDQKARNIPFTTRQVWPSGICALMLVLLYISRK